MLVIMLILHSAPSFPARASWDESFLEVQKVANDTARKFEPREHVQGAFARLLEVKPTGICRKTFVTVLWPSGERRMISPLSSISVVSQSE